MRRIVLAVVVALSLVACGDGDDDGGDVDTLRGAVERYTEAFGAGDSDTAYSMLSERCQDQIDQDEYADQVDAVSNLFGPLEVTSFEAGVDGDQASTSYSVSEASLSQSDQRWTHEGGEWRWDAC